MAGILAKGLEVSVGNHRVGAIDCGTNSIRLLIADRVDGRLVDLHREMRIVRLGQGVDATGQFAPDALARTEAALIDYAELLSSFGVSASAWWRPRRPGRGQQGGVLRDDRRGARQGLPGAVAEVITGAQEAELSFNGAVGELDSSEAPFVVVDLGGGSTEVVLGDRDGVQASFSADIGCVRLTERCLPFRPADRRQVARPAGGARASRGGPAGRFPSTGRGPGSGVAGTFYEIAAPAAQLTTYDPAAIHLSRVPVRELLPVSAQLIGMTRSQRAPRWRPMHERGSRRHRRRRAIVVGGTRPRARYPGRHRRTRRQRARHPGRDRAVDQH